MTKNPPPMQELLAKTAIITGAANGIGAQTARLLSAYGANIVIADLESARSAAEILITSLEKPSSALFVPTNILSWSQMKGLFKRATEHFGSVEIVVANAGMMESQSVFDLSDVDGSGELKESTDGFRVIDVNLKALRLALHNMSSNKPCFSDSSRGSVVLVTSTSGYFGGTGVGAYVASKHGVTGLLRASQSTARRTGIRVNAVAPFFTPTHITASFTEQWLAAGLMANTPNDVALTIAKVSVLANESGSCYMIAGRMEREVEAPLKSLIRPWLGEDVQGLMVSAEKLFDKMGGYPLPTRRRQGAAPAI